ncbi:hypothetical protein LPUS_12380 [Lasallia pustulata]|uniref:Uncharacterized protein n=1 Tax=Lasallia pustulata TaxID=136370 RepID=A0A1W5DED1_9LECA|nr:hypothetical protein LPUS_12380 [Lasallia pustulata]
MSDMSRFRPRSDDNTGPRQSNNPTNTTIPWRGQTTRLQDMSREELFQEFGRLQHANHSLERAVTIAEEKEKTLRNEHTVLTTKKGELTAANAELSQSLMTSKAEIKLLKDRISGLQAQIGKMEKTIKVQSEQISKKPEVNNTPQRHIPVAPSFVHQDVLLTQPISYRHNPVAPPFVHQDTFLAQPDPRALVYGQAPPSYNPRRTQATSSYAAPTLHRQQNSMIRASTTYSPDLASTQLSRQQSFAGQPLVPFGTTSVHDELATNMNALTMQTEDTAEVDFPTELNYLFKLSETWARNYANVPDHGRDKAIPRALVDTFMRASNQSVAYSLLISGSSRYFLVAKLINAWMTENFLKISLVKGFSSSTDQDIRQAKKTCQDKDASIGLQRACLVLMATAVKDIHRDPKFEAWLQTSINAKAAPMWGQLSFLLAPGADTAWEDFRYLVAEAHRIGFRMLSVPIKISFAYPDVGPHTYFEPSSMLCRDANIKGDPQAWKHQQLRVRLGITPVVVTTDIMGDGIPKTVHLANVLLMQ